MARRIKVTGFTRFLLFLIIVTPTIFFSVAYFKGVDGVQMLKDIVNGDFSSITNETPATSQPEEQEETAPPPAPPSSSQINGTITKLQDELETKDKRIEELYQENAQLKEQLEETEEELESVQQQLETIKKAIGGE